MQFALINHLFNITSPANRIVNPGLKIFSNTRNHLSGPPEGDNIGVLPEKGEEYVMTWPDPATGKTMSRPVTSEDLLVLKMTTENLDPGEVARRSGSYPAAINGAVLRALQAGIILGPAPGIIRSLSSGAAGNPVGARKVPDEFGTARVFALQWHITQACDLHCRHCYDRIPCDPLSLDEEIAILDSLYEFCSSHHLFGQVTFTGGNPLLHPHFQRLYQEASDRGFFIGILGNPATREEIESLVAIQPPAFYQVSLEGLESHNDYIRGPGHFKRVLVFLEILRQCGVYSKVMLTLTRDNLNQVIPLGKFLEDRVDVFTFNRLSPVGEGATLAAVEPESYGIFLETYAQAVKTHSVFGLKDNLFNILQFKNQSPLFGGCTGHGCGAAFNFVSVLATGAVHACRKFPSPIGNITRESLTRIYHSPAARQYRKGPDDCQACPLNLVCRGCMAASHGLGQDVFARKDPYCFF